MNFSHQSFNSLKYSESLCNTLDKKTNDSATGLSESYGMAVGTKASASFQGQT
jgi:hypothetical protein